MTDSCSQDQIITVLIPISNSAVSQKVIYYIVIVYQYLFQTHYYLSQNTTVVYHNRASLTTHTRGPGQHSHHPHISFFPFHSPPLIKGKGKGRYSSSWELHLRATGRHLPYGITQCYLPPDKVNVPRLTPAMQAGTRFTYPGGMEG